MSVNILFCLVDPDNAVTEIGCAFSILNNKHNFIKYSHAKCNVMLHVQSNIYSWKLGMVTIGSVQ